MKDDKANMKKPLQPERGQNPGAGQKGPLDQKQGGGSLGQNKGAPQGGQGKPLDRNQGGKNWQDNSGKK